VKLEENTDPTKEILRKVRQIEIRTRKLVTEALTGAYHSSFKGQGMDFDEVREYFPGDDVRSIDWNVTARMNTPFIKKFREERELTIFLVIDLSESGNFSSNTQTLRDQAAEIASVLALSATRNDDKVGILLFTDQIELIVRPAKGRQHILRLIREILFFKPKGKGTNLPIALEYLNQVQRRKAIVFLLSDFLPGNHQSPTDTLRLLNLTSQRHDLSCILLRDYREEELPDVGWISLEDSETGQVVEVNTSDSRMRELYARENKARVEQLETTLRKKGIDFFCAYTGQPYMHALRVYMKTRSKRR
jgi:uncharacterized protein (DUF58 family)